MISLKKMKAESWLYLFVLVSFKKMKAGKKRSGHRRLDESFRKLINLSREGT